MRKCTSYIVSSFKAKSCTESTHLYKWFVTVSSWLVKQYMVNIKKIYSLIYNGSFGLLFSMIVLVRLSPLLLATCKSVEYKLEKTLLRNSWNYVCYCLALHLSHTGIVRALQLNIDLNTLYLSCVYWNNWNCYLLRSTKSSRKQH